MSDSGNISMEKLIKKTDSIYKLVILAARRASELNEGAARLVETDSAEHPLLIALKEITEGKVFYKTKPQKE